MIENRHFAGDYTSNYYESTWLNSWPQVEKHFGARSVALSACLFDGEHDETGKGMKDIVGKDARFEPR